MHIKGDAFEIYDQCINMSIEYQERDSAFCRRLQTFAIINISHVDCRLFLEDVFTHFKSQLEKILEDQFIVKVNCCFSAVFSKKSISDNKEVEEKQTSHIWTFTQMIDFETNLLEFYNEYIMGYILQKIDDTVLKGSGFTLCEIVEMVVQVNQYDPIAGSSYIPLPKVLATKTAVVNVQNKDNLCFKYAVLSALFPPKSNAHRISNYYPYMNLLKFDGISFPIQVREIQKFEKLNVQLKISINVYTFDEKSQKIRTLRITRDEKENHVHLLLLTEGDISHYCWIKNLSRLLSAQISTDHRVKQFCDVCLNYFFDESKLQAHKNSCSLQNECQIELPTTDKSILKFKNFSKQLQIPFVIYADIETVLKKVDHPLGRSDNTKCYQKHEPYSVGYFLKCSFDDSKSYYEHFRGEDCITKFIQKLHHIAMEVEVVLNNNIPLKMSNEEEHTFKRADFCHICDQKYNLNDIRVRDHCHLTGRYRGSAHGNCNLIYRESRTIPIIFHNLTNYDAHFLIRALANVFKGLITVIPQTDQNYIAFTKTVPSAQSKKFNDFIKLQFIDSFRFMSSSLDQLAALLPSQQKSNLYNECMKMNYTSDQIKLLERKGVFCYDYIDNINKLNDIELPPIEAFYSKLTDSDISVTEYEFAKKIWITFQEIKTLGDYSDLYLKCDVLLLTDVFENFRKNCLKIYKLDPVHYYTAPGLSFDAMLRYTKVEIELLTDIDMLLFVEQGIRGGISQCSKRYSKANNKYTPGFNPNIDSSYLMYLDANNLYGYAMMQYLPLDGFEWIDVTSFNEKTIGDISQDSMYGYIFEVDLDYPDSIHEYHQDYPMCAENMLVPETKNDRKLLLTLFNKKKYVIHYRMLQCVLKQGLILKRIHRGIKFRQEQWLKPYIQLNTDLRTKADIDFEKNLYKLLINAIFGKTMENLRLRIEIYLKTVYEGRYGAKKLISQPNFKMSTIFDESLVAIHMNKTKILIDKPIIIGMSILELSKIIMYEFHYNHMKMKYGENIQLMYTGKCTRDELVESK